MYNFIYAIVVFTVLNSGTANAFTLSTEPFAIFYTPDSIIHQASLQDFKQYVGTRTRLSTCTGVAWFSDSRNLISANLLESSMQTYGFEPSNKMLFQRIKFDTSITLLGWPENLSASKDGSLLAISNSYTGKVNIYSVDAQTTTLNPSPITQIEAGDHGLHGVRFSSDGQYLGYVTYDGLGKIRIFHISAAMTDGKPLFVLSCSLDCTFEGLAPKGIDFSHDLKFVAVCYSGKANSGSDLSGKLAIFKFDAENGIMDSNPISELASAEVLSIPEDVLFYSDDSCLLVSNQGNDTITIHEFDPETGNIHNSYVALKSPEAQLNFPHGISISPDGKYFAVSNYGDDKICVYTIGPD